MVTALSPFRQNLVELGRDELLSILADQDMEMVDHIEHIEQVFETKLQHLNWPDGRPIQGRPFTPRELALLIDEPFSPSTELDKLGIRLAQQRELHYAKDPVLFAKYFLGVTPRVYQALILREPNDRKVLRAGRRLGKTYAMAIMLLHYSYTHRDGRCIVVAPMKSQVEVIYKEIQKMANNSKIVKESVVRSITSPQFAVEFSNGSTIKFFTSGIRSGGKADVVRGQEAHIIVLDELDYMHVDDLDSLLAMLQKTSDDQDDKILIGASTPTGRRERFYDWCNDERFAEFWFPAYCNPFWEQGELEDELRGRYSEMAYRHEIEADWGEIAEGVYPRRYLDIAFSSAIDVERTEENTEHIKELSDWVYSPYPVSARAFHVMGVDWDKYGAGTNIVVLEVCQEDHEDPRARGRVRVAYREEVDRDEYTLTNAVQRIIELNGQFNPRHIYVDRGFGETQVELLRKHGTEFPTTQLTVRVKGISFAETVEMKDPYTKQPTKKEIKPFMVDHLRMLLERGQIIFPSHDDLFYEQLLEYTVLRHTSTGRPVFEGSPSKGDHIHDALILACFALAENYDDLMRVRYATQARVISNEVFLPLVDIGNDDAREMKREVLESAYGGEVTPVAVRRAMSVSLGRHSMSRPIRRKMI